MMGVKFQGIAGKPVFAEIYTWAKTEPNLRFAYISSGLSLASNQTLTQLLTDSPSLFGRTTGNK